MNLKKYNPYIIIFTLLLETMFIGLINVVLATSQDISRLRAFVPFANAVLLALTIFVIVSINQTVKNIRKEMEGRLLKNHLQQMDDMVKALYTYHQQHSRQLQTLQAMLDIEEYDQACDYIDDITRKYTPVFEILNIGDPALTTLLYSKQKVAETKGVEYDFAIKCPLENIGIPSSDLCAMIGHLLDNALEACMQVAPPRRATLEIKYETECYVIYVFNNGPEISDAEKHRIFEAGYTTAASAGRGFGLYQVQLLVESYGGKIEVVTHPKTTFIITLPGGGRNIVKEHSFTVSRTDGALPAVNGR